MYRVFDDKFANTTTVIIQVLDVNDNAPRFDNAIYNVTDVQEEEEGISKNNHKYLLTVCSAFRTFSKSFYLFFYSMHCCCKNKVDSCMTVHVYTH